jgi:putative transposase
VLQAPLSRLPGDYAPASRPARRKARNGIPDTNPLERLNKEVKRRADVVGIFPNEAAIVRLIGAVLLEANDEWQLQHRYIQTEAMAELTPPLIDAMPTQISTAAA